LEDSKKENREEDALMMVQLRNAFYKKKFHFILGTNVFCFVVIVILGSILFYLLNNPTRPLYFVADSVGRLMQEPALTDPYLSTDEVTAWTIEAVQSAYSYNYMNYRAQLQNAQKYFTEYGWKKYMDALTASNNLLALTQRNMVFIATVVQKPKLLNQGILGGAYAWKFQIPLLIKYWRPPFDDKSAFFNALQVNVVVQRQTLLQSYKGLAVLQMIATTPPASTLQNIGSSPTETPPG
jgi:intracellular multiplication protein IcmL